MSNLRKARHLYNLMRSQWKPYEELRELQNQKLRVIVKHAYENVPFYREKFDKDGIHPKDIKTVEDLPKLSITTKQEIRDNFPGRTLARGIDIKKCWLPHTSGSTGIPLKVAYDEAAEDFEKAVALRANLACGQGLFDKWVVITTPLDITERRRRWFQRFGLFSTVDISMFLDLDEQISIIEQINPKVIDGYSSALYVLAKEIRKRGIDIHPKIVFGTGEVLTKEMRQAINSAFGVEVYDQFGCVELARTAWECPAHTGCHIDVEAVVMEFIRNGKKVEPGETGEIIYTSLYNYAMPLIRYAVGDVGIPSDEKCPCGRGLPLMKAIQGRSNSLIQTPSGRIFPELTFWSIMGTFVERDRIGQFKVIQEKIDRIRVQILPEEGFTSKTADDLRENIKAVLGEDMTVDIETVENMPYDKSGKLRSVISKVKLEW